jgi:hypothetical protein
MCDLRKWRAPACSRKAAGKKISISKQRKVFFLLFLERPVYTKHTFVLSLGLVESSPPATEETGAMGREIESRQGIGR